MNQIKFWILDDKKSDISAFRQAAKDLPDFKIRFRVFGKASVFLQTLRQGPQPDVAIIDLQLNSKQDGFEVCAEIQKKYPSITLCVFSRYLDEENTRMASQVGASAVISKQKPIEVQLREFLKTYLARSDLQLKKASFTALDTANFPVLGQSTKKIIQGILQVVREDLTLGLLLTGPPGTGKSHILNALSILLGKSFKKSILRPPFTESAIRGAAGVPEQWLFIDDLDRMSFNLQEFLFKLISAQKTQRRPRLLATTRSSLEKLRAEVIDGMMSQKLINYLSAEHFQIPPLSLRKEEIPVFFQDFISKLPNGPFLVAPEVSAKISRAQFDEGNVEELRSTVEKMGARARSGKISMSCLPAHFLVPELSLDRRFILELSADTLHYPTLSNRLLLELIRKAAFQDLQAGRKTTVRSLERRLALSRTAISERLDALQNSGEVSQEELNHMFGKKNEPRKN